MPHAIAKLTTLSAGDDEDSSDDNGSLPVDPMRLKRGVGLCPPKTKASDDDTLTTEPTADSSLSAIISKSSEVASESDQSTGGRLYTASDISQFAHLLTKGGTSADFLEDDVLYEREKQKPLSKIHETAGRAKEIQEAQVVQGKKQDTILENQDKFKADQDKLLAESKQSLENDGTMLGKQDKSLENDETMIAGINTANTAIKTLFARQKQWEEDNGPSKKVLLARAEARHKKEMAERLRIQQRANELEAQLEAERRINARRRRKHPTVLSDSSNAVLTEPEQKAEKKHVTNHHPETQKEAAAKKSENAPFGRSSRR